MRPIPFPVTQKSTTVRARFVRAAARIAPGLVLRALADQFLRPIRRPKLPSPPSASTPGHAFTLEVGGETLAAWDWGQGPTVLLLHGWSGHAGQMSAFIDPLVAAGHHVVALDLPAHSRSTGTHTTLVHLSSVIAELGRRFRPLHGIIAHSFGAAATGLAFPKGLQLERAVLLGAPRQPQQFVHSFAAMVGLPGDQTEAFGHAVQRRVGVPFSAVDVVPAVRDASAEVLVVHDLDDGEVPFVDGQAIAEAAPRGRFLSTRGLGHRKLLRDAGVLQQVLHFMTRRADAATGEEGVVPAEREAALFARVAS